MEDVPILPPHVEATVRAIARVHADHRDGGGALQHGMDRLVRLMARPRFSLLVFAAFLVWIGWNVVGAQLSHTVAFDPPPFSWLQMLATLAALYVTLNILATQRREHELAELREQLALDLAVVNEQKTAKIIQLIQELRRELPEVTDGGEDAEADAMASPNDPQIILEAIKHSHDGREHHHGPLLPRDDLD